VLGYNARMQALPSSARVVALAGNAASAVAFEIVAETGSTNADLLARVATLTQPTLRWAQRQTAGRGRAGRPWLAADDGALTFSLAWKLTLSPQALSGLSLAVGVALARQLAARGVAVQLKWPNDLLRDGAKLAGILIETAADRRERGALWVVIGVGLNLAQGDELGAQLGRAAADIGQPQADREAWMAALLAGLCEMLPVFECEGFAPFAQEWNGFDAYAGCEVNILDRGEVLHHGRAVGVDEAGRLLLDTAAGRVTVMAGDVSLRMAENGCHAVGS